MKYSKEFKEEALKLSDEIGLKKAAQQLGIQYYTLSDWRSNRNAAAKAMKYQRLMMKLNSVLLRVMLFFVIARSSVYRTF